MYLGDDVSKPKAQDVLHSNALLNVLTPDEIKTLSAVSRPVRAERGEVLWFCGADVDFIGLSADGFVKMIRTSPTGSDVTIELFGPGHMFGLMGVITGNGCPLTAVAVSDLWYLRIPKSHIKEIYGRNIPLKDKLLRKAALRLHGAVDLMARMSSGRVDQRIAAILYLLAESYAVKDPLGIRLQCPLTRQEIGEMAGTTVESTIRVLSRWQKEGMVTTDRQHIVIMDDKKMTQLLAV